MATVTSVYTIEHAAKLLGEDPEIIEAIISNDDNLSYGNIISICNGSEESIMTLTRLGLEELRDMLTYARRSEAAWNDFLEDFLDDPDVIERFKNPEPR